MCDVMNITLYKIHPGPSNVRIEPASRSREWMLKDSGFAGRCLPLVMANQHGWAIYPNEKVYAEWDGGDLVESVRTQGPAASHFGRGILTFFVDYIFRLPEGYSLYITGEPNNPKYGITPLTGIYEADWAPYSFTMNWQFTMAHQTVVFEENEPFCFIFPIKRDLIEQFRIEYKSIEDDPQLKEHYNNWADKRDTFNNDPNRTIDQWQKHYFRGLYPDGKKCPFDHKTKLKLDNGS